MTPAEREKQIEDRYAALRDQFACAALTGMLAYSHVNPMAGNVTENGTCLDAAKLAYQYADAMLKARDGGQP
jgi:hypothetical protein